LAFRKTLVVFLALIACALSVAQQTESAAAPAPKPAAKDALLQETFDASAADALMGRIGEGIAGHDRKLLLSAFDKEKYPNFNELRMLVNGWMDRNRRFLVHYKMLASSMQGPRGAATARFEIETAPRDADFPPYRRNVLVKIEAERSKDGWRVVLLQPEDFFSE